MSKDPQDKTDPKTTGRQTTIRRSTATPVLPVGLGRQAMAPRVEAWGLVVQLKRPVASPVLLSRKQAAKVGRALVEALYPARAERRALARAGQVLALADGLMSTDTFLHDQDIRQELDELRAYLGRMLPGAPAEGEERTPWMALADCFHATDKSNDTAAFATGLYDEPDAVSLCLPFFRAHFEHQGAALDPFGGVFTDAAYRPASAALYGALAEALGVAGSDVQDLALVPLHRAEAEADAEADAVDARHLNGDGASPAFGSAGHEGVLLALAQQDKHQLDDCHAGEELARALKAMQAQAVDEQAIQYGWRRGVPVAVRPSGEVLLGFSTVDEMAHALRGLPEGAAYSGEQVALRWQRWLLEHYIPVLQDFLNAGCSALAFSAPAVAERLAAAGGRAGIRRELPLLEAVVVEHGRHEGGDVATGAHVQAWRCLALREAPSGAKVRTPGQGEAFLLCVVVLVLDEDGHPVQQTNFFHTTPFAADVLQDSAEHHALGLKLPLEWQNTVLEVGDDLRLTVSEGHELQVSPRPAWKQTSPRRDH
jgi:hypothetical protein